jgi:hypothetical protein
MHDLDRTQLEASGDPEGDFEEEYESLDENEIDESEYYGEMDEFYGEMDASNELGSDEGEYDELEEGEMYGEDEYGEPVREAGAGSLDEAREMGLAAELLGVSGEQELDQFLPALVGAALPLAGKLFGGGRPSRRRRARPPAAVPMAQTFLQSGTGRALVSGLRQTARQVLPALGGDLGGYIGARFGSRARGRQGGRALGRSLTTIFGLELEGLSPDVQEYEAARRFVRFATLATRQAALAPPQAPPASVVRKAIAVAARRHMPGLVRGPLPVAFGPGPSGRRTGRWIRRGRRIIILGA